MSSIVKLSVEYFADPTKGRPVSNGNIYIGVVDLDPEIESNQKQISVIQEDGTTVEVAQPLKTSPGGVPVYNNSPVTITVSGGYSLKVTNKNGSEVYYVPKSSTLAVEEVITTVDTIQELRDSDIHLLSKTVKVLEVGEAGTFVWDSSNLSSEVSADINSTTYIALSTDLTGTSGAWVRVNDRYDYPTVDTIQDLRDYPIKSTTKTQTVKVLGYYTKGDGGGDLFLWNVSSTVADNGGSVIKLASELTGRFESTTPDEVNTKKWGCRGDETTDDTVRAQAAVTYCVANALDLDVIGLVRITASLNIDRLVDTAAADTYFNIYTSNGGGFYVDSAIPMFSTTIPFTTAPVSQMIKFSDIEFQASDAALNAFVLDDAKFLRMQFSSCSFLKIKCLYAPTVFTQSIYFFGCNARRWEGVFFRSLNVSFDTKFQGNLAEAGETFAELDFPVANSFIGNTIEGMSGTAIKAQGSQGLTVHGNYFEFNDMDMDTSGSASLGMSILGNYFSHNAGEHSTDWSITWGPAESAMSAGNYSSHKLHDLDSASKVAIRDYAITLVTNRAGQSEIPFNVPTFNAYLSAPQAAVTGVWTKVPVNTENFDTNANLDGTGKFQPTIPGYYKFSGKINFIVAGGTMTLRLVAIYKNGSEFERLSQNPLSVSDACLEGGDTEILMNGSTDYVELYGYIVGTGTLTFGSATIPESSRFSGSFVRSIGV
jgi:hypothetical protein